MTTTSLAPQNADFALYSDRVLWPDFSVRPATLGVRGRDIIGVWPLTASELKSTAPTLPIEDLSGWVVTPALVNAHTHLAMSALRGLGRRTARDQDVIGDIFFRIESKLEPGDVRAFTRLGAYQCLLSGIAEVWDHYYFGREVADALVDTGLSGVVSPTLQDLSGPGALRWQAELDTTLEIAASASYREAGVLAALGPHAPDTVSTSLWEEVKRLAQLHELPVHCHLAQSYAEIANLSARDGQRPLASLLDRGLLDVPKALLVHCIYASVPELRRLDPARHVLGFCPYSELAYCFPARADRWEACSLSYVVATDSVACNDSMNLLKELRFVAAEPALETAYSQKYADFLSDGRAPEGVESALGDALAAQSDRGKPSELLSHVWSIPGTLHPSSRSGVIAAGARANLALWDPRHPAFWPGEDVPRILACGDAVGALAGLMIGGRFIGKVGSFASSILESDAYRAAVAEASQRRTALFRRAGVE